MKLTTPDSDDIYAPEVKPWVNKIAHVKIIGAIHSEVNYPDLNVKQC